MQLQIAVHAGSYLGVYELLAGAGGLTVAELAQRIGCGERRLRVLVDVLLAAGVLASAGPAHRVEIGPRFSPPAPPSPLGARLLADLIRGDRHHEGGRGGLGLAADARALAVDRLLSDLGERPASELVRLLAARLGPGDRFLDAGGGFGTVTALLLAAAPTAEALLVDRPDVVAVARRVVGRFGARAGFLAADLDRLALAPGFRVALLANVLHLNPIRAGAGIVARVAAAVLPGGEVWIKEPDVEGPVDRAATLTARLFALGAIALSAQGEVPGRRAITFWMEAAGLVDIHASALASAPESVLLVGRVPVAQSCHTM